jgi:hypothetical protein
MYIYTTIYIWLYVSDGVPRKPYAAVQYVYVYSKYIYSIYKCTWL